MTPLVLASLVAGLLLLVGGAELLVRGASRLAARLGITPLVIGLTVVAFGTSAPELAVSVEAGLAARPDIALGNVVGSNIANILLILGLAALLAPLAVSARLIRVELPLLIGVSLLLLLMSLDGRIGPVDGAALFAGVVAYTVFAIRQSRRAAASTAPEPERVADSGVPGGLPAHVLLVAAGLGMLVLGAHWLVGGAVAVARWLGVGELVIGLTVVAVGTSLPEIATSAVAALRGERDIAVGNVVGSCLFNILAILGVAALVTPGGLAVAASLVRLDIPVMIAAALACLPVFLSGRRVTRGEGALFLGYYSAYLLYLVMAAKGHAALPAFGAVMLGIVLPSTVVMLAVLWAREVRRARVAMQ